MNERNLVDLFLKQAHRYGSRMALRVKRAGAYRNVSWETFRESVILLAHGLSRLNVRKSDRIALLSENRPEWAYADLATLARGAVVVPIYPSASLKEVEHILTHCEASLLFVSTQDQLDRLKPLFPSLKFLRSIIVFDSVPSEGNIISLSEVMSSSRGRLDDLLKEIHSWVAGVGLDDLATIIYTSGTTGPPKGVMLSHGNFLINCYDAREALPLSDSDVTISFLPLSHVFERMAGYYLPILCGATIAYAENMNTVPENLLEVRPSVACGVPRFFEKMHAKIQAEVQARGKLAQNIFHWAIGVGRRSGRFRMEQRRMPSLLWCQYVLASSLVFSNISRKLGGRLRCFISGGAPLARELAEFFYSAGVLILEGYGLTETSPVISANRPERFKFGTVGIPLKNVKTRIAEDGEVLVRGPSIMAGYYKNEQATREAMEGGWFHTGDLGMIDQEGFLSITGRKKDIIVTSGGKNISPQNIEGLILGDKLISQIVVVGDRHNFLTALVVPNFDELRRALKTTGQSAGESPQELVQSRAAHNLIRLRIDERTKDSASYEQIKHFTLMAREFSHEKGEMTLTLKIKRPVVGEHFREAIDRMYRETENRTDAGAERIFYVI